MSEIPVNKFCFLVGLDSNGEMYIETIFNCQDKNNEDIAELLFLVTSGALNTDIKKHISKQCKGQGIVASIIKKWNALSSTFDDKPLIDSLQVPGE